MAASAAPLRRLTPFRNTTRSICARSPTVFFFARRRPSFCPSTKKGRPAAGGAHRSSLAGARKWFQRTFSDADGNFWIQGLGIPIPANSRVGVRTADGKKMNMAGAVGPGQAGCNQVGTCHGGTAGGVFVK